MATEEKRTGSGSPPHPNPRLLRLLRKVRGVGLGLGRALGRVEAEVGVEVVVGGWVGVGVRLALLTRLTSGLRLR